MNNNGKSVTETQRQVCIFGVYLDISLEMWRIAKEYFAILFNETAMSF